MVGLVRESGPQNGRNIQVKDLRKMAQIDDDIMANQPSP